MTYLDHAASTPLWPEVVSLITESLESEYANPSSLHAAAREGRKAIEIAREQVAHALGARPEEIIFTGSGTESDNLGLIGAARRARGSGRVKVIVSAIEHAAVLGAGDALAAEGFEVVRAPVTADGVIDLERFDALLDATTAVVSVMAANNETGVIQPIDAIAERVRAFKVPLHVDAVQALPWMDLTSLPADLVSVSAHKIGGPKGVGALRLRRGVRVQPLLHGGGHERGLRPGTMPTVTIAAFGLAVQRTVDTRTETVARVRALRDRLEAGLVAGVRGVRVSGEASDRLPGHCHVTIPGVESEPLLLLLDAAGIAASGGSACQSGAATPSHVLTAMGLDAKTALCAVRLTLGRTTTDADVDVVIEALRAGVERMRR